MLLQSFPTNDASYQCLIADCGGTKTDWCLLSLNGEAFRFKTEGFNVSLRPVEEFHHFILENLSPFPSLLQSLQEVHFYGAGCTESIIPKVEQVFQNLFLSAHSHIYSDLLGAARALCGNERGIAVILGTGSNSCLFDGEKIIRSISPLGYILGDEGSGAVLGRRLLSDIFKGLLPSDIIKLFHSEHALSQAELIQHVYRESGANHYMASFVPFLGKHKEHPAIQQLLQEEFNRFFDRNILPYSCPKEPISFVGGVANAFREILMSIAEEKGLVTQNFLASPIDGLALYHSKLL